MNQGEELELFAMDWGVCLGMQGSEDSNIGQREKLTCDDEVAAETSADPVGAQDLVWSIRVVPNGGQMTDLCVSTLESHWQGKGQGLGGNLE